MNRKKIILAFAILALSLAALAFRGEVLAGVRALAQESAAMPAVVGGILIALKAAAAPLGLPATPITLLTGSLLGKFWGTVVAVIGNTLGAILAFLLSRYVFKEYVQRILLARHPAVRAYEERLERRGLETVIMLRLIPLVPFNALNYLLGVTNIPFGAYALGSFIGMIPGTFVFVYFGESLRMLSLVNILFAAIGIIGLASIGALYGKRIEKQQKLSPRP